MNFFLKTQASFGLDVSGSSFKIMQLGRSRVGLHIKAYADVPLPKGLIVNDLVTDSKTFSYLVKQTLDKPGFGRLGTDHAIVSLPESKSFVRVIQIPKMNDSEAANAIPFEAENFIPLPIDQVYLDWQKLGENADHMNILIIAAPREFVDRYLKILDDVGIKTAALEVESQSCYRALVPTGSQETELLVDLDAFRTSLIMVEDGFLQFTSSVPVAGNTFTESIARNLGVSSAKAEEIKRKVGINNTTEYPNIKTALMPVLNNLSSEIKNILKFHSDHSEKQVSKIVLVGGSAKIKNLAEFLAPQIEDFAAVPVELGNPWQNVKELKEPPLDPNESLSYATAIGLALRGVEE